MEPHDGLETDAPARGRRLPTALVSLLVAVLLTVGAFPEVVFLGGSFTADRLDGVVDQTETARPTGLYPTAGRRQLSDGVEDAGTRSWQVQPSAIALQRMVRDGETPTWNPYSASGTPGLVHLVDLSTSPFVVAVALAGGSPTAYTFVHLAFLVLALYCLQQFFVRTLGLHRVAAVGAGVVFLLNGWAILMAASSMAATYVLFPVVLYTLTEYHRRPGPARLLVAVAAYVGLLVTTFLSVALVMIVFVQLLALVLAVWRTSRTGAVTWDAPRIVSLLGQQALVPALAAAVSAVVLVPVFDAVRQVGDESDGYFGSLGSQPLVSALSVLTPNHVFSTFDRSSYPAEVDPNGFVTYLGLSPLVLLAAAVPRADGLRRRLVVATTLLVVLGAALHLGLPVVRLLHRIPVFSPVGERYWIVLSAAAATVGVGVAVDVARRSGLSGRVGFVVAGLMASAFVVAAIGTERLTRATTLWAFLGVVVVLAMTLGLIVFVADPGRRRLGSALVVVLVAAELMAYAPHERAERFDVTADPPDYVTFLQANLGDGRIHNIGRGGLVPEWGAALGIRQVGTMLHVQQPWYRDFYLAWIHSAEGRTRFLAMGGDPDLPFTAQPLALDTLSVRYLVVDERWETADAQVADRYPLAFDDVEAGIRVYENPTAYPRAFVSGALRADDGSQFVPWSPQVTATEDPDLLAAAAEAGVASTTAPVDGTALVVEDHHDRVVVDVESSDPAMLVLADSYHPDWSVEVDGVPAHLGRVDDVLRGVVVPAGSSQVVFTYASPSRRLGWWISLLSLVLLVAGCAVWGWRRRAGPVAGERPGPVRTGEAPVPSEE